MSARPFRTARPDPRLTATLGGRKPLFYEEGPSHAEDRPAFVRAASGLAWLEGAVAVIQDDAGFVGLYGRDGCVRAAALPRGPGGRRRFEERLGNKRNKLDLEACVTVPGKSGQLLLAFGSGSTRERERVLLLDLAEESSARVLSVPKLFSQIRSALDLGEGELNLEGAVIVQDRIRLFQRGNGIKRPRNAPPNATVDFELARLLAWLDAGATEAPALTATCDYDLGAIGGVCYGFTDAAVFGDNRVLFVAAAEDSPDAVRDGEVLGTRVGVIDEDAARFTDLRDESGALACLKAEGVLADPEDSRKAWIVLDPDDPDRPAELCELLLSGPW